MNRKSIGGARKKQKFFYRPVEILQKGCIKRGSIAPPIGRSVSDRRCVLLLLPPGRRRLLGDLLAPFVAEVFRSRLPALRPAHLAELRHVRAVLLLETDGFSRRLIETAHVLR